MPSRRSAIKFRGSNQEYKQTHNGGIHRAWTTGTLVDFRSVNDYNACSGLVGLVDIINGQNRQ